MSIQDIRSEYPEYLYCDLDHEFQLCTMMALEQSEKYCGYHAAHNYLGFVWREGLKYYEEIWKDKELIEILSGDSLEEVVQKAVEKYGSG